MKNLSQFQDGSYPMLCKIKYTSSAFDKTTRVESGTAAIEFVDINVLSVGDELKHHGSMIVAEIIESRAARGVHKFPDATWFKILCDYQTTKP